MNNGPGIRRIGEIERLWSRSTLVKNDGAAGGRISNPRIRLRLISEKGAPQCRPMQWSQQSRLYRTASTAIHSIARSCTAKKEKRKLTARSVCTNAT